LNAAPALDTSRERVRGVAARVGEVRVKGLVFTEFIDMVDDRFSLETSERLIEACDLPSGGVYTSVGTYDAAEMMALVGTLSSMTGVPVPDLLREFVGHLFRRFVLAFPEFFEGIQSTLDFLPRVEDYVHLEVRKLYPDAELPTFTCERPGQDTLIMTYRSHTNVPDLAEGLIVACLEHFGDEFTLRRDELPGDPPPTVFTLSER
jgi:hypothetical protein